MATIATCPKCGSPLVNGRLEGLCPKCVGLLAFDSPILPDSTEEGCDPPRRLGDYDLIEEIARGGMGVVFRARQRSLNRIVAVKLLLSGQFASKQFLERFRAEAQMTARLQHPNIVPVYEVGEANGQPYFSMELVQGQNLAELVRDQPLAPDRAAGYMKAIAEAVHYAHGKGILHRDLKPANVLIDGFDNPRVTDFGLAKQLQGDSELTLTGQVIGSPSFASPEQAAGLREKVGPESDVYALGAILYYLLTGRPPFRAATVAETVHQVKNSEPVSPHSLNPAIPRDLETICLKCLAKEPGRRYLTAEQFAGELGRFLRGEPIHARPVTLAEKVWRWCRRKPALAALVLALNLVGAAGLVGILWQWSRAERHATSETTQRLRAEEAVTSLELQRAEDLLEKEEIVMGVAYLARIVRQQPTNHIATQRLLSALTQRDFALPLGPPLQHDRKVNYAEFSPDGRWVVTASLDFTARLWDARTGQAAGEPMLHSNAVRYAHFSPDGQRLVTVADDPAAQLWETATSRRIGQPLRHEKRVKFAQFSPDGRQVVTASDDQTARLWDARTGEPLSPLFQHAAPVRWVWFSPDGRWIVTIPADDTARVWDAQSGQPVGKPLTHGTQVNSAQFSPDSRWVVTASYDGTARVWEVTTGQPLTEPLRHKDRVSWAEFSTDGQRVATASEDGAAHLWNARTGEPLAAPLAHRGGVVTAQFSPDGQRLLTGFPDNAMRVWDTQTGRILTAPFQHDGLIWSACFSPDGQFVVTASADKTARIWDVRPGRAVNVPLVHADRVHNVIFSPDDEWLATGSENAAQIWSVRTGRLRTPPLTHGGLVATASFSPDGQRVLTGSYDGTARLWDARTRQPLTEPIRHDGQVNWAEFSPDGKWFLTVSANTAVRVWDAVRLWDARAGQLRSELIRKREVGGFAHFSPDSRSVIFGLSDDDSARIVDIDTGKTLVELRGHGGWIPNAEFSSDGRRIVTASEDGTARIWDTATGAQLTTPLFHKGIVWGACFSSDGLRVVTASADATARVWDALTGGVVTEPLRHRGRVNGARFSPDGQRVITASDDGTARLWNARTGRPLTEPFQHAGYVVFATFSHDGQRVATASYDGTARIWELPPALGSTGHWPVPPGDSPGGTGGLREKFRFASGARDGSVVPFGGSPNGAGESPAPPISESILLADLAEAVIGQRLGESDSLEPAPPHRLGELRQQLSSNSPTNDFTRWLAWFLADRSTRTISPYSQVSLPEYIDARADETNVVSWREALMLCPTNGVAFAQMAGHLMRQSTGQGTPEAVRADWASRQAVKFAPWDAKAWHYRRILLERTASWAELLAEAEEAIRLQSSNAYAWNAKAQALEAMHKFESAIEACNRALEIWALDKTIQWDVDLRKDVLLKRANTFRRLGRLAEAGADNAEFFGLAARDPQARPELIDLGAFYNGGEFEALPGGIHRVAGTDFDMRGWIHLRRVEPEVTHLPERVDGIRVERKCRRLHFLHTASLASHLAPTSAGVPEEVFDVPLGVAVGRYIVRYVDGQQVDIPILHGRDVLDYWQFPESLPNGLVAAWTGTTAASRRAGATTRLYKQTWENPRPDVPLSSLDFVHAKTHAVPILVAITAEP